MTNPKPVRYLYFVRHGRAEYRTGFGGRLTAEGRRQARAAAKRVGQQPISAIYTSDFGRAVETAQIIARHCGDLPIRRTPVLREMIAFRPPGQRVPTEWIVRGKEQIAAAYKRFFRPCRTTRHEVIVSHGNTIRSLACLVLKTRLTAVREMDTSNSAITRFAVWPKGRVTLLSYNETGHLPLDLITFV